MTPRPHGSVEGQREWTIYRPKNSAVRGVIGPSLKQGEHVRVVEAPVSPPEEAKQELPTADDVRGILKGYERYDPEARVEELEAALREILWRRGDPSVVRQVARHALRGSVPAGEDDDDSIRSQVAREQKGKDDYYG